MMLLQYLGCALIIDYVSEEDKYVQILLDLQYLHVPMLISSPIILHLCPYFTSYTTSVFSDMEKPENLLL